MCSDRAARMNNIVNLYGTFKHIKLWCNPDQGWPVRRQPSGNCPSPTHALGQPLGCFVPAFRCVRLPPKLRGMQRHLGCSLPKFIHLNMIDMLL